VAVDVKDDRVPATGRDGDAPATGRDGDAPAKGRDGGADGQARALGLNIGWTVFSYLIAGMAAYGAIGWLIGRAVHTAILFPLGMLVGLGISLGYVIYRYGRAGQGGADR
jgi:F0F1-type ATP synthase assembly protein I